MDSLQDFPLTSQVIWTTFNYSLLDLKAELKKKKKVS